MVYWISTLSPEDNIVVSVALISSSIKALEIIDAWMVIDSVRVLDVSFCAVIVNQKSPVFSGVSPEGTVMTSLTDCI